MINKKKCVVMSVAGSDSGGGAGIQMDIKTFEALNVFGVTAITAVTAQNPYEVRGIYPLPPKAVLAQIDTVFAKFAISAFKTGMLFNADIIELLAGYILKNRIKIPFILDPVMVSTSGTVLLPKKAMHALMDKLIPHATWITPNIPEAEILANMQISSLETMLAATEKCHAKWGVSTIIKGGHFKKQNKLKTDTVCFKNQIFLLQSPNIKAKSVHGTGCAFSAALTAFFAKGLSCNEALKSAKKFIYLSIRDSVSLKKNIIGLNPQFNTLENVPIKLVYIQN